jgi:FlaA1/EpsC-like NDP-sugar epimerase
MELKKQTSFDKMLQNRKFLYARTFALNLALFSLAYYGAFALKSDWFRAANSASAFAIFKTSICWVLAIKFAVFYASRQYRNMGYYATMRELRSIVLESSVAFVVATCGFAAAHSLDWINYRVSLSVFLIDFMLTIGFRGGWRLARRFYFESVLPKFDDQEVEPAFLVGANNRGAHVANAINSQPDLPYRVVGFLTIHDYKVRLRIGSLPVVAHIDNLVFAAKERNVKTILCVAGLLPGKTFREIYERCDKNGLKLEIVPQVEFIPDTKTPIREVKVDDLLKRDPIRLDTERIKRQVTGRRVMVTGAGGSIGSEICRQLMRFEPAELFILGRGENRIFFLERELRALGKSTKITPIIADVSNKERVDGVFDAAKPEIVFHAAAHKHVPLMESNVPEAIRNNIYGTKVVADAADRCGAEKFVMVSTDKAVNPTNVMGCSKQMAERYVNALAERSKTKFIVTRFGNVLGSNGSVVPIFTKQIQQGGPITITDFRMTRYFMTIPEAAQLVLEAGAMGQGGEIFVLDMGEPVKIETLARDLIRLSGLPENAIEIREVGLRPGEKLYEELYFETETRIETDQKKIFAANHRQFKLEEIQAQLDELLSMTGGPQEKIRERLTDFVPEYKPTVLPEKK